MQSLNSGSEPNNIHQLHMSKNNMLIDTYKISYNIQNNKPEGDQSLLRRNLVSIIISITMKIENDSPNKSNFCFTLNYCITLNDNFFHQLGLILEYFS